MTELPSSFYYVVGLLLVTNLSAIGGFVTLALKTVWWASKIDSQVAETRAMTVRAHKRIDTIEGKEI